MIQSQKSNSKCYKLCSFYHRAAGIELHFWVCHCCLLAVLFLVSLDEIYFLCKARFAYFISFRNALLPNRHRFTEFKKSSHGSRKLLDSFAQPLLVHKVTLMSKQLRNVKAIQSESHMQICYSP